MFVYLFLFFIYILFNTHTQRTSSNRYPIAGSCGRVLQHLLALPGKGAASSDTIASNDCIKRFSVPTISPTSRWAVWHSPLGNTTRRRGGVQKKDGRRGTDKREETAVSVRGGLRWRTTVKGGQNKKRWWKEARRSTMALLFTSSWVALERPDSGRFSKSINVWHGKKKVCKCSR